MMVMVMMKGNRTDLEIQIHKICETNPNVFQKYQNVVAEILGLKCFWETFWKGAKNLGRAPPIICTKSKGTALFSQDTFPNEKFLIGKL